MKIKQRILFGLLLGTFSIQMAMADQYKECDLNQVKEDVSFNILTFSNDPSGLAVEVKKDANANTDVMQLFQNYADQNKCELYVLPSADLAAGILKDFNEGAEDNTKSTQEKYLLVTGKKYNAMVELNFKLPIKVVKP